MHQARPAPLGSARVWRSGEGVDAEAGGRAQFEEAGFRAEDVRIERFRPLPLDAVLRFFRVCDAAGDGMVAVHCRTGRGRTAAMIGLWLMREYRLTARDATVWLRLVRPGTRRPSGLPAPVAPRSHVSCALLPRLGAQAGAGGPALGPGARGAGVGRFARSRRARLGRPAAGDPGAVGSARAARRGRGRGGGRGGRGGVRGQRHGVALDEEYCQLLWQGWTSAHRACGGCCGPLYYRQRFGGRVGGWSSLALMAARVGSMRSLSRRTPTHDSDSNLPGQSDPERGCSRMLSSSRRAGAACARP